MTAIILSILAFVLLCLAIETGQALQRRGGARYTPETKDTVKQATGIVATLTALVLGLLIANGQKSFEQQSAAISSLAAGISSLDETLHRFGPPADQARSDLRAALEPILQALWQDQAEASLDPASRQRNEAFITEIMALPTAAAEQQQLKASALGMANTLVQERFRLATLEHSVLPGALVAALMIWSSVVFMGLGFCASRDGFARAALYAAAGAAATAIFLVVEYDTAFTGLIQVSRKPMEVLAAALAGG